MYRDLHASDIFVAELILVLGLVRSMPPTRPNRPKCVSNVRPYIRPSVRPQKVSSISTKFGMQVDVHD